MKYFVIFVMFFLGIIIEGWSIGEEQRVTQEYEARQLEMLILPFLFYASGLIALVIVVRKFVIKKKIDRIRNEH
jgi:uncharacterized protein HemY